LRALYFDKVIPRALAVKALRPLWPGVIWSPLAPFRDGIRPDPPLPGPRWLRVRNRQCGICASDIALLQVEADPRASIAAEPGLRRIYLGHEADGDVVEIGPGVRRFKVGERVVIEARPVGSPNCHTQEIEPLCRQCAAGQSRFCENASAGIGPEGIGGGWSDSFTAHESEVWPVPDDLSDDQASLIEPMSVAMHAVLRARPATRDKVLVVGAGSIGLLTLQAIKALVPEAEASILAKYDHQAAAAHSLGADRVIRSEDVYQTIADATGAKFYKSPFNRGMLLGGFDVIFDCVGKPETITDSLRWARARGRVVQVGSTFAPMQVDLTPNFYQEVDLIGSLTFGTESLNDVERHTFELVIEMLQEGVLTDAGLITHRFPFDDYRRAIQVARDKRQESIKVELMFDHGAPPAGA
jgi:threonine dehydrogenase-like Zn-dependent dehydrogenase